MDREATFRHLHRLKYEYCRSFDRGDFERFQDLFAEDFVLVHSRYGDDIADRDEMKEWFGWRMDYFVRDGEEVEMAHNTHLAMNPVIDLTSESSATGEWYYVTVTELASGDIEFGVGEYDDEYVREDGTWKLAKTDAIRRHTMPM